MYLTVKEEYEHWWKAIHPKGDAGATQTEECKRSFYAGTLIAMGILKKIADEYDEDTATLLLEGLDEEIHLYFQELVVTLEKSKK